MLGTRHILLSSGRLKYTALRVHDGVERTGGHRMIDRPLKARVEGYRASESFRHLGLGGGFGLISGLGSRDFPLAFRALGVGVFRA